MYHFTLATKKTANAEPKYNGDIIWDESDGPKHLKFWTGGKYERLSDMVQQEIKKHNGSEKIISSTPETDIAEYYIRGEGNFVRSDICRKLERERDEARALVNQKAVLLETANCECAMLKNQRDETREALRDWQTLRLWGAEPQHIHDFIKGQQVRIHEAQDIEKTCEQLERERDEAMAKYAAEATDHMLAVNKLCNERDEAREALDCLLAVIGLTPIAGNKHALQEAVDNGLAVLRKQKEAAK